MDVLDFAPGVSSDGSEIALGLSERIGGVECAVTREALKVHFWLPRGTGASRMLRTFVDGRNRIVAEAERKMLARPDQPVRLTSNDLTKC